MDPQLNNHVGRRLRAQRKLKGLTLRELGAAAGLRPQQIHKYETGANQLSAARLWRLAQVLGVDMNYFFAGLGRDAPADRDDQAA